MHKHTAKTETTVGYRHPVGPVEQQDERAHGGVCHVETCACGAQRHTNSNGRHKERGEWYLAQHETFTVRPLGGTAWSTGVESLQLARQHASGARGAGLRQVVIVRDSDGAVVE